LKLAHEENVEWLRGQGGDNIQLTGFFF
jgi:hypothetical protein